MRLGQLARIYDVSAKEIISYLEEVGSVQESLHHNSKLNEQTKAMLAKHFNYVEQISEEASEEIEQKHTEPEVVELEQSTEAFQSELDPPLPEAKLKDLQKDEEVIEEVVIETDRLLELLESEESSVDLSKITLIKAPKKQLTGLKVVGKIELPESKSKSIEKSESQAKEAEKSVRRQPRKLSEEELEKRRLKAKKRKEEYQARQERRRKEKEKKQSKALNEVHYRQKLQRIRSSQPKQKDKTPKPHSSSKAQEAPPVPKTLLGKFWRWMNT